MKTMPLPLVTPLENRTSSLAKDAKMVNAYAEPVDKTRVMMVKRPGHDAGTLYEAATVQGVVTYLGVARVVVNNKLYKTSSTSVALAADGLAVDFA